MNDQTIEQEIQAKGLTAARVTLAQIDALMARVTYVGGRVGETTSTVVHAFLDGAFLLASGHSACVSVENFDAELGTKMATRQAEAKARDQLWLLEGYALRTLLTQAPTAPAAELERAYRCIQGMHNALQKGSEFAVGYHAPTIAAAKRFVFEGDLGGSEYFIGKPVEALHAALKLPAA
jgi:hypothetical protein